MDFKDEIRQFTKRAVISKDWKTAEPFGRVVAVCKIFSILHIAIKPEEDIGLHYIP